MHINMNSIKTQLFVLLQPLFQDIWIVSFEIIKEKATRHKCHDMSVLPFLSASNLRLDGELTSICTPKYFTDFKICTEHKLQIKFATI
jgi:hypothetical protein